MSEDGRWVYVIAGEECIERGHKPRAENDDVPCEDCELVAAHAIVAGKDPNEGIRVFRAWTLPDPDDPRLTALS